MRNSLKLFPAPLLVQINSPWETAWILQKSKAGQSSSSILRRRRNTLTALPASPIQRPAGLDVGCPCAPCSLAALSPLSRSSQAKGRHAPRSGPLLSAGRDNPDTDGAGRWG